MTIAHHPGEELLLAYALGASSQPVALLVATHLSFCATCSRTVGEMEAAGGAMLSNIEPVALETSAFQTTLSRRGDRLPSNARQTAVASDVPSPLRAYIGDRFADVRWVPMAPGLAQVRLITRGRSRARLIRARPGSGVSLHSHRGEEWTLVLTGSYHDESGQYGPGDVQATTPDVFHRPIANEGPVCINLAVTDAPLVFKDLVPAIVGKVFGF